MAVRSVISTLNPDGSEVILNVYETGQYPVETRRDARRAAGSLTIMSDSLADRVRGLLASDVYTRPGQAAVRRSPGPRARRARAGGRRRPGSGTLTSAWRQNRVPPSTREQSLPPAEGLAPIRLGERLIRAIDDTSGAVRGLPLLNADQV